MLIMTEQIMATTEETSNLRNKGTTIINFIVFGDAIGWVVCVICKTENEGNQIAIGQPLC
jgi:hypothetical protein